MTRDGRSTSSPSSAVLGAAHVHPAAQPGRVGLMWLVRRCSRWPAIFVLLEAQFIAAIQVLVYAGAIMVLFLFVIMLLNLGRTATDLRGAGRRSPRRWSRRACWWSSWSRSGRTRRPGWPPRCACAACPSPRRRSPAAAPQATGQRGVVGAIAAPLFETYLVPFEITSVLLLAAMVGAVVLAKRRI